MTARMNEHAVLIKIKIGQAWTLNKLGSPPFVLDEKLSPAMNDDPQVKKAANKHPANFTDLLLDAVCAVDAEGRFVFASAACERIFGYAPAGGGGGGGRE